jgi:hypothetical protein
LIFIKLQKCLLNLELAAPLQFQYGVRIKKTST